MSSAGTSLNHFKRLSPFLGVVLLSLATVSCVLTPSAPEVDNGIFVDAKIYNNRALQNQLQILSSRLNAISGIDQASLTSRLGSLQGATSSQFSMNLQATGLAQPSTTTTATSGTPSVSQTSGGTTTTLTPQVVQTVGTTTNTPTPQIVQTTNSGTPTSPPTTQTVTTTVSGTTGTTSQTVTTTPSNTVGTTNQTVTNTPSNTLQTVTAAPAVTPSVPQLQPSAPISSPSNFSVSSSDVLREQVQLSYQIVNLQLLLQGALSDEYTPAQGLGKRHVTFGFPASIETPERYKDDVAEVEISVCNPDDLREATPVTVQTIIPQEKTYNTASIVGSSVGLGAGAVVGGVVNIGANFSWTHQTFYLVKAQDTVALRRARGVSVPDCKDKQAPATFAWQFKPVLGQKTVEQGSRSLFAQLSFAPSAAPPPLEEAGMPAKIYVRTCWRTYHRKSGIAGDRIPDSCYPALDKSPRPIDVTTGYDTLAMHGVESIDNGDGTLTTTVYGRFPAGTRVGLGEAYLDESMPGFENSGTFLRFTATAQVLAVRGPRLLSPDGSIRPIILTGDFDEPVDAISPTTIFAPGQYTQIPIVKDGGKPVATKPAAGGFTFDINSGDTSWKSRFTFTRPFRSGETQADCHVPYANSPVVKASAIPYSDTQVKIVVPVWQCLEMGSLSVVPKYVVIMNGKAFGLSDAPFLSYGATEISFLVPKIFVQGVTSLTLKRLFVSDQYASTFSLAPSSVSVSAITLASASSLDATFAITGSGLQSAAFDYPWHRPFTCCDDTYGLVTLSSRELATVKHLRLIPQDHSTPIIVPLPSVSKPADDGTDDAKARYPIVIVQNDKTATTYAITAVGGSASLQGATFIKPKVAETDITRADATHLLFKLSAADAGSTKVAIIQLATKAGAGPLVPITLPTPAKNDEASSKELSFDTSQAPLKKGATGSYTLKGTNFQLVASVRYAGAELAFHCSDDLTALTIEQLPANFTANVGKVPLKIGLGSGASQVYDVTVSE